MADESRTIKESKYCGKKNKTIYIRMLKPESQCKANLFY